MKRVVGPANIQEFVARKVVLHMHYKEEEIEKLKKLVRTYESELSYCVTCDEWLNGRERVSGECSGCGHYTHCTKEMCSSKRCEKCQTEICYGCRGFCDVAACDRVMCERCLINVDCFGCFAKGEETNYFCDEHAKVEEMSISNTNIVAPLCFFCKDNMPNAVVHEMDKHELTRKFIEWEKRN